jgi:hypothetical protein
MRTTLTIGDDVYKAARNLALSRQVAIGEALTELARRGLRQSEPYREEKGLPLFSVAETARPFGLDDVQRAEDEE